MVSLHGEMLIDRLISVFLSNNPESIYIIINEDSEILEEHLSQTDYAFPIHIVRKSTPSSLHSFYEIVKAAKDVENLCLTTTDTVFKENEFKQFISEFENNNGVDGLMAVTTFVDDESPLFVDVDASHHITAFKDKNENQTPFISGGIYCLRKKALDLVADSVENGTNRLRNFQRHMLDNGVKLKAHVFSKIVDVDHVADIHTAELFLREEKELQTIEN